MKIKKTSIYNSLRQTQMVSIAQVFKTLVLLCVLLLSTLNPIMAGATYQALKLTPEEITWIDENKDNIRYGPNPYWPPGDFMENGEHKGIVSDYIKIFEKKLGITFKKVYYDNWEGFYHGMMTGELDLVGAAQETEERKKVLVFTKPFLKTRLAVLTRTNSPALKSLDSLNAMTLAGVKGYSSLDYVKTRYPGAKIIGCDDDLTVLLKMSAGAADGAIVDYMMASYLVDKYSITNIKFAKELDFHWDLRFAISKEMPQLRSILDKVLSTISEEERQDIYHKWVSIEVERKPSFVEQHLKIIAGLFLFILFILFMVIFFNQSLKKKVLKRTEELKVIADKLEERTKELSVSEGRLRSLFDNAPFPIMVHADDGRIDMTNQKWTEITGYSLAEISTIADWIEKSFWEEKEDVQKRIAPLYQINKRIDDGEFTIKTRDDKIVVWDFSSAPLGQMPDDEKLIVCMAKDVTENKMLEKKLQQAQKMEAVGRLAGGVAHDYNNMLSVILGYADLAKEKVGPQDPLYEDLNQILIAGKRSEDITRQLLAFARQQTISPKVLDLNRTVESMLKMLRRLIGEDLDMFWHPCKQLWPIKMDPSQIDQLLANLCVNARDAITDVGKITIGTGKMTFDEAYCADHAGFIPGDFVMLAVNDDGCGMDKEIQEKIFEPFFTTKGVGRGTGLGLATVYGIVKQNNGFINVYSEPDNGTTFKIYLPRYQGAHPEERKQSSEALSGGRNERILIVEDEPQTLGLAERMLSSLGYRILATTIPTEAIQLAEVHTDISLLITDVVMPEMNGRELCERIKALSPGIKCLFMSGYTADVIAHRGMLEENVNFVQKPFSKKDLAKKVRDTLDEQAEKKNGPMSLSENRQAHRSEIE